MVFYAYKHVFESFATSDSYWELPGSLVYWNAGTHFEILCSFLQFLHENSMIEA